LTTSPRCSAGPGCSPTGWAANSDRAVAVVVPPRLTEISEKFLALRTDPAGLRVALFRDEPAARQWLATFEVR
jgi:hypothetical protein